MVRHQHHSRAAWNDRAKHLLSFDERHLPHVAAVHGEHVERDEGERPLPLHQVDEDRPAALVELHDLAVEHGVVGVRFEGNLGTEIIEATVVEPAPGHELRPAPGHEGQRPEAVVLQLEEPVGMVEGLAATLKRHRSEDRQLRRRHSEEAKIAYPPGCSTTFASARRQPVRPTLDVRRGLRHCGFEGSQDLTRGARITRVDEGTTGGDS